MVFIGGTVKRLLAEGNHILTSQQALAWASTTNIPGRTFIHVTSADITEHANSFSLEDYYKIIPGT